MLDSKTCPRSREWRGPPAFPLDSLGRVTGSCGGSPRQEPVQRPARSRRCANGVGPEQKPFLARTSLILDAPRELETQGVEAPQHEEAPMQDPSPSVLAPPHPASGLDRLG